MATDFTRMFNRDGGPLMPTVAPPADYAPEQANPYLDLYNAAAGDPARPSLYQRRGRGSGPAAA